MFAVIERIPLPRRIRRPVYATARDGCRSVACISATHRVAQAVGLQCARDATAVRSSRRRRTSSSSSRATAMTGMPNSASHFLRGGQSRLGRAPGDPARSARRPAWRPAPRITSERFADRRARGDHVVDDQHATGERRADQQCRPRRASWLPCGRRRRGTSRAVTFGQRDARSRSPARCPCRPDRTACRTRSPNWPPPAHRPADPAQAAPPGIEQPGVEEIRADAPRLQREFAEAQRVALQWQVRGSRVDSAA